MTELLESFCGARKAGPWREEFAMTEQGFSDCPREGRVFARSDFDTRDDRSGGSLSKSILETLESATF